MAIFTALTVRVALTAKADEIWLLPIMKDYTQITSFSIILKVRDDYYYYYYY